MLGIRDVYKLQSDYSVADGRHRDAETSFGDYVAQCRSFITANLPSDFHNGTWDGEKKTQVMLTLTSQFVDHHNVKVRGYVSKEGVLDSDLLLQDLIDAVTGVSILKDALEDIEVDEIQINDKDTIFVSKRGVLVPYTDKRGRVMQFTNNEEIHIVLNKLIDDSTGNMPQFTDGNPILNAKTAKHQYRVNAVHHVANTMAKPPNAFPITSVVIRKFKEVKLTIEDLVENEAVTAKMGRLLTLFGRAELKLFCVGPTGSGKTTLLNIIAGTIPLNKRIILVQNPTEISFMERDEYGRNIRNVVHWEVMDKVALSDLVTNTLRATPEIIIVGEAREASEFKEILRVMRTGHKVLGTFHAEDADDAMERFADEAGVDIRKVTSTVDIIISQLRFPDGRRRVMEISEVEGVTEDGKAKIRKLFEFKLSGEVELNEYGLEDVKGHFVQVGVLSEKVKNAFYKAGISHKTIAEFCDMEDIDKAS